MQLCIIASTGIAITIQPSNATVAESMLASFQCVVVSSLPELIIEWWFTQPGNEQQPMLVADQRGSKLADYSVQASTFNVTLIILNASSAFHQGTYTCRVQSSNITAEESAVLTILRM